MKKIIDNYYAIILVLSIFGIIMYAFGDLACKLTGEFPMMLKIISMIMMAPMGLYGFIGIAIYCVEN